MIQKRKTIGSLAAGGRGGRRHFHRHPTSSTSTTTCSSVVQCSSSITSSSGGTRFMVVVLTGLLLLVIHNVLSGGGDVRPLGGGPSFSASSSRGPQLKPRITDLDSIEAAVVVKNNKANTVDESPSAKSDPVDYDDNSRAHRAQAADTATPAAGSSAGTVTAEDSESSRLKPTTTRKSIHPADDDAAAVETRQTATTTLKAKSNRKKSKPHRSAAALLVVELTDPLILARDAPPSRSLFYSPAFHDNLRPIGEIGRRKYADLTLWRSTSSTDKEDNNNNNKFGRELLSYSVDEMIRRHERDQLLDYMDEKEIDDYLLRFEERDYRPGDCVQPGWTDLQFPVCNVFHELQIETAEQDWQVRYLAHGYYRDSFRFDTARATAATSSDAFVWKRIRIKDRFTYGLKLQTQIRTEALIMERLTGSNRTTNMYGYCATSLAVEVARDITEDIVPFSTALHQVERGRISQKQLEKLQRQYQSPIFNFNNFTLPEKLELAIAVAEGIAEMHGYHESVMVNDDVHPDQWLIAPDGRIILNDMNNAQFLDWNFEKQEYCPYYSSYGGDFRAPEEYVGSDVDESVDIYPMANMIFSILTGLWPWYELLHDQRRELQRQAMDGKMPYFNPLYRTNSYIEGRLVELMEQCYAREPQQRPSIFDVVRHLRETRRVHWEKEQSQQQ